LVNGKANKYCNTLVYREDIPGEGMQVYVRDLMSELCVLLWTYLCM